jgi:flagellar hook protein FlgE
MMRSLFSGVAGLKTHQTKMDVIGNNISNVNTVGFKSSSTSFQDIMYQTMSGASAPTNTKGGINANQIGLGVTTGATKVSITHAGAAQSTGEALDIRLTDTNSTNFFIVNNGSQNLFTRSGSFYLDGNGNLAMTSTGYLVQGWQVDESTGQIKRDTVSPLRIMNADNLTSQPEATTQATFSGIVDKNDTNINSVDGYSTTLVFYDDLGYAYTARFAIKKSEDGDTSNGYTVALTNIYSNSEKDAAGNPIDLLANHISDKTAAATTDEEKAKAERTAVADLFGSENGTQVDSFKLNSPTYTLSADKKKIVTGSGTNAKTADIPADWTFDSVINGLKFKDANGVEDTNATPLTQIFSGLSAGMTNYAVSEAGVWKAKPGVTATLSFDEKTQALKVTTDAVNYDLDFSKADGTFSSISGKVPGAGGTPGTNKGTGGDTQVLKVSTLGTNFHDITVDFSKLINFDNGGTSTATSDRGTVADKSDGAGKKLGTMTGVQVQQDGKIFGSYDNGNTVLLGQIAVAQFANASGLESLGNNCYGETLNSGSFDGIGRDVTADGGSMNTGQLEMSNVDLSTEFTEMITTQRGFQANSRIITVSDTMLEELVNLKR